MPTPAYLDTDLYLPLGGVNGFEVNGFAVNGFGFVDNPFFGVEFQLDPYRSILPMDRGEVDLGSIDPSLLAAQPSVSAPRTEDLEVQVWAPRCESEVRPERVEASLAATPMALVDEVEAISFVPTEYRTAYVLASHPATLSQDRALTQVEELPPSQKQDQLDVSVVPQEDRTSKVRRI